MGLTAPGDVPSFELPFFLPRPLYRPMNKAELVDEVQKLLGAETSNAAAERAVDAVLAAVGRGLRRDKEVQLVGFGAFAVATRAARRGFNPHTKQPMKIRAMKTVRFKAGAALRALA
jgi:DNA-binding protein HU-beta